MSSFDVVIAGGGIIGISLALELRQRGAAVLVLDRGEPGRESSSAAAGMLAAADPETPPALREFAFASARLYPEFVRKIENWSGMSVDFRRQGSIAILETTGTPPGHKWLSLPELQKLEPELQVQHHAGFFVQEDSVDPELLMRALLLAARHLGIEVRTHTPVQEMRSSNGQAEIIAADERLSARTAVNCRGAWAGAPVRPRKGQMLYLQPQKTGLLTHVVRTPDIYLVPRSSSKILVGATVEDVGYDKTVDRRTIHNLHRSAADVVPALAEAAVVSSWAGLRPGTPDDLPIIGLTETPNVFIATGHFRNGILLCPATAVIMADLIAGKIPEIDVSAFSPERFVSSVSPRGPINYS